MRSWLLTLLLLLFPFTGAQAFDESGDPDQYDSAEQYAEEPSPEDTYPAEPAPDETAPDDGVHGDSVMEETYQDPDVLAHKQEVRAQCQAYAADMPPEDQATYVEDCMNSQGY